MCRGGVAVDECVLGRRVLVLQGAERLGVLEHESNVGDVGNREDSEAGETKLVGWIGRLLRQVRAVSYSMCTLPFLAPSLIEKHISLCWDFPPFVRRLSDSALTC